MSLIRKAFVMVVEDSDDDFYAFCRACRDLAPSVEFHRCCDVESARKYLDATVGGDATRPDLIILDLNLAGSDGRALLQRVKTDPDLRIIPVVVHTTSRAASDVRSCLERHANAYHVKPLEFDDMKREVASILEYWTRYPLSLATAL